MYEWTQPAPARRMKKVFANQYPAKMTMEGTSEITQGNETPQGNY